MARTWRTYSLHAKKADAEAALKLWCEEQEARGMVVTGSMSRGRYVARSEEEVPPGAAGLAPESAGIIKLADHPLCYIGVLWTDVERLRRMENEEDPDFERCSAAAKAISEEWRQV